MAVFMCPVCGKRTVKPGSHIGEADLGTYTLDCDDCREVLYLVSVRHGEQTKALEEIERVSGVVSVEGFDGEIYGT